MDCDLSDWVRRASARPVGASDAAGSTSCASRAQDTGIPVFSLLKELNWTMRTRTAKEWNNNNNHVLAVFLLKVKRKWRIRGEIRSDGVGSCFATHSILMQGRNLSA
jgi:hypothetical protein